MNRLLIANVLASVGFLQATGQTPTFRSSVDVVPVYVLVTSADGRIVTDLGKDDFLLKEDGRERAITTFSSAEQPITGVLLLDVSGSLGNRFLRVKAAASHLVDALRDDDRLRIGTFADEVGISPHLTSNKSTLRRVLADEVWLGGGTALWRAVNTGMTSLARESGRRVVLVASDGRDSGMFPSTRREVSTAVRNRAIREAFVVCAIEIHGRPIHMDLTNLTTVTGGGSIMLQHDADFRLALDLMLSQLRHQYLLGFVPARMDGKFHRLSVTVKRPGHRVRSPAEVFVGK